MGVQSFDDGLLAGMERLEKYGSGEVIRQRLAAVQGIFPTLNVDMIFNLPGQSLAMLEHDLDVLRDLGVDQISFYPLMTAPTARHKMEKTMGQNDPSLRLPMYQRILERLLGAEYHAASAWCFSRNQGMFDEYIIDQADYVGVGSGAFSYVGGAYYSTTFSLNHYCRRIEGGQSGITQRRPVSRKDQMRYDYLVRLFGGELKRDYIERRYGKAFWLLMAPELLAMRALGATRHDAGCDPPHAPRHVLLGADDGRVLQLGELGPRADARAHPRRAGNLERRSKDTRRGDRSRADAQSRRKLTMQDTHVSLAHGNGGRYMRELIQEIFARHLANPYLDTDTDAAVLPWNAADGQLAFTTDSFTVQPIEFPGGNIGSLAVHGTTNDLAVAGAVPKYLSLGVLLEEGLEFAVLERIVAGIAQAANEIGVVVAAGDTKVVRRGEGGGIYLNTSGIGVRNPALRLGVKEISAGDAILVSGPVGDHGIAVMLAREQFGLRGDLKSDAASVLPHHARTGALPGPALHARPHARRPCDRGPRDRAGHRPRRETRRDARARARFRALGLRNARLRPVFPGVRRSRGRGRVAGRSGSRTGCRARAALRRRCRDHRRRAGATAPRRAAHAAGRGTRDRGTRGRSAAENLLKEVTSG